MRGTGAKFCVVAAAVCGLLAVGGGFALLFRGNRIVVEVPPAWKDKVDVIAIPIGAKTIFALAQVDDGTFLWDAAPTGRYLVVVVPRVVEPSAHKSTSGPARPEPRGPDDPDPPCEPLTAPVGHTVHSVAVNRWKPTVIRSSPLPLDDAARVTIELELDQRKSFGRGLGASGDVNFNDAGRRPEQRFRLVFSKSGTDLPLQPYIVDEHYEYLLEPGEYRLRTEPGNATSLRLQKGERRVVKIVDGRVRDVE